MMAAMAVVALVAGPVMAQDAPPIAFSCASGETLNVSLRTDGGAAEVKYGDKSPVRVVSRTAKEGSRFTDSRHELRIVGAEASWRVGGRSAVKCSTTDTARLALLDR
jgi:hypothetical protein